MPFASPVACSLLTRSVAMCVVLQYVAGRVAVRVAVRGNATYLPHLLWPAPSQVDDPFFPGLGCFAKEAICNLS